MAKIFRPHYRHNYRAEGMATSLIVLFFIIWVVLNGRLTFEIVWTGALVTLAIYAIMHFFMGYDARRERNTLRLAPKAIAYFGVLLREIVLANFQVMRLLFSPKYEVEPVLVEFDAPLRTTLARTALANSITLTPGTIAASLEGGRLRVHCLDKSMSEGLADSEFVKRLAEMEGMV